MSLLTALAVRRRMSFALAVAGACAIGTFAAPVASASSCSNVEVLFARGTNEAPGLGAVGTPFAESVEKKLSGKESVSSYAIKYEAGLLQLSAGEGATNMTEHVEATAAKCPKTAFVLGGYSQGASVTDISIGISTILGKGKTIPTKLAPKIAAIVVFGNPLRLFGETISSASPLYGSRTLEYCNTGDPICANGLDFEAHLEYASNGDATAGGKWAAEEVLKL
jgi:cutinase